MMTPEEKLQAVKKTLDAYYTNQCIYVEQCCDAKAIKRTTCIKIGKRRAAHELLETLGAFLID